MNPKEIWARLQVLIKNGKHFHSAKATAQNELQCVCYCICNYTGSH